MVRGTFAIVRLTNPMVPGIEGGVMVFQPGGARMSIYDAAMKYKDAGTPLVILPKRRVLAGPEPHLHITQHCAQARRDEKHVLHPVVVIVLRDDRHEVEGPPFDRIGESVRQFSK